ncbi:MAG TPA: hypothetical protein VH482_34130 [Thermomicrobiales bacterium]
MSAPRSRFPTPAAQVVVACVLLAVGLLIGPVRRGTAPPAAAHVATPAASPVATNGSVPGGEATGPLRVTVGLYVVEVHGLDQQQSTYEADFYLWMRWRGERDPTPTIELLNSVERWGLTMRQLNPEPIVLPSGERMQQFHVQGQFFEPLSLEDYPLDKHALTIKIEDSTYSSDQQVYVPDVEQSNINPQLQLPGWQITGWSLAEHRYQYATNFGDTSAGAPEYSRAEFTLRIERPPSFFRWKLLLPLLIVLLLGCSVLVVHPTYTEVRLAGPATALLTLVFLQQTYTSTLPEIGGLVLLDKIYALAYLVVVGLIATTILTSHWVRTGEAEAARAQRLDRLVAIALFGLFLVGTAILLIPVL